MQGRTLLTAGESIAAGPASCAAMLFEDGRYEEAANRFSVSEDGRKFVAPGKKCHDIFDLSGHLGVVLALPYRKSINASRYEFVAQGGKVLGKSWLQRRLGTVTDGGFERALDDGFMKCGEGASPRSRYLAGGFAQGKTWSSFAHS